MDGVDFLVLIHGWCGFFSSNTWMPFCFFLIFIRLKTMGRSMTCSCWKTNQVSWHPIIFYSPLLSLCWLVRVLVVHQMFLTFPPFPPPWGSCRELLNHDKSTGVWAFAFPTLLDTLPYCAKYLKHILVVDDPAVENTHKWCSNVKSFMYSIHLFYIFLL